MEPLNQPLSSPSKVNVIDRAKNIIIQPDKEWNVIESEKPDTRQILTGYVLILAGAAAVAAFIGFAIVGFNVMGVAYRGMEWGLYQFLVVLAGAFLSVFVTAFVVDTLAPSFNAEKNLDRSIQLVAYSFTPVWVGGLLAIIPAISFIGTLFGLYCLYLMYTGLPKIKKVPAEKHTGYFVVTLIVTILVYVIVGWLLSTILMSIFGLSYGTWRI